MGVQFTVSSRQRTNSSCAMPSAFGTDRGAPELEQAPQLLIIVDGDVRIGRREYRTTRHRAQAHLRLLVQAKMVGAAVRAVTLPACSSRSSPWA
jgi:hypothetical protein